MISPTLTLIFTVIDLFAGIMLIVSALKLNSINLKAIKIWSYAAIIFAVISNIGAFFNLGFIIALIGGIIGVIYSAKKPNKKPIAAIVLIIIGGLIVLGLSLITLLFLFGLF